jgi:hypothetical protein
MAEMKTYSILFIALVFFNLIKNAGAADITYPSGRNGTSDAAMQIEGRIELGDFVKFEKLIRKLVGKVRLVNLFSPGGNVTEAIKIGRLVRKLRLSTAAPFQPKGFDTFPYSGANDRKNYVCLSSCFFIYIAGISRGGNTIGIHRPYLSPETYKKMSVGKAGKSQDFIRGVTLEYLTEMDVPGSYIEKMFSTPPDDIFNLKQKEINQYFDGYIPKFYDWLSAKCNDVFPQQEREVYNRILKTKGGLTKFQKTELTPLLLKNTIFTRCLIGQGDSLRSKAGKAWLGSLPKQ